tara:strand:- start:10 stop:543 length:534 start_codon:yes stop_codon:yes gene_type:complete
MLMNVSQYARHRDVSRQTIYTALKTGRIEKEPCGKIESVKADRAWEPKATIKPGPAPTEPPEPDVDDQVDDDEEEDDGYGYDYQTARARREHYSAELTELKAAVEKGDLVRVAEVEREWANILTTLRTRLLSLPDRLCDELATIDDPHVVQQLMADEVTDLLVQVSAELTDNDDDDG